VSTGRRSDPAAEHPPWSAGEACAAVLGAHIVLIISSVVVFGIGGWTSGAIPPWGQLLALIPYWLAALEVSRRFWARSGRSPIRWLVADEPALRQAMQVAVGVIAGLVTSLLLVPALYAPLHQWWGTTPDDLEGPARLLVEQANGPGGVAALVLMTCVGAPVVEEVLYRGVLQPGLARLGTVASIMVSSAVFAAIHLQPLQFAGLLLIGVVLALLRWWSDGLAAPIAAHVAFNAVTVVVLLAQR